MGALRQRLIVLCFISASIFVNCEPEEYFRWQRVTFASVERGIILIKLRTHRLLNPLNSGFVSNQCVNKN